MNYKNLLYEVNNHVALVTINRPEKLNSLNNETLDELESCFKEIKNDKDVYVVIITGSGEKAFVAGADISELNKLNVISAKAFAEKGQAIFNLIENLGKPVIAAVNGFALGGGCELALACHIRFASDRAKFGQPEVNLGIIPGYGGTQRLTRIVGSGRAAELILSGDLIDAEEAYRIGLVNKIFSPEELLNETKKFAEKISSKGQVAISLALKAIVSCDELSESEGQNLESSLFAICCGTEDFKEGTSAFLEKRKPVFKNL
ncbi:enoyl-CoA hydratase-related protein [Stygiobacter electus]|jgi:enoyl-CoA hydratase|uniref:Enoyl-CoA hydratase-related protein n=1 Tax=Stygiobacter electus TaxID=3032292 RepID=A0AAE3NY30_9BACT|nr:enoyl-CoA hydratase-related protein [Stygiobacter electus]MDF1610842.1 enoyl-CoA hydratase-related protein [Stygiobacter electus]